MSEGKLILVRHGETDANRRRCFAESDDILLTDTGRQQAHELAARLARDFHVLRIYSSVFARAQETAAIVASALGLAATIMPGLHERNFGFLKGRPYERMGEAMLADSLYDPERTWLWTPPGGESLDTVRKRAMAALDTLRSQAPGNSVVVCHGAVIQSVCAHITGQWSESFVPPNCGLVEIEFTPGGWKQPIVSGAWEELRA